MALRKSEFLCLREYATNPSATQRALADATGLSLGTVNAACKKLASLELVADGSLTQAGWDALAPYKVDNAIIMAAGMSSRFAPISYEKPKGLLKVRDEILIERHIRQLKEAGINDITVVVGYKQEYFFYLEDLFDVRLVFNPQYASRNNTSTLIRVVDSLGSTYICSSDNYMTENPYHQWEWQAFYSAQYCEGPTPEWCMQTGAHDRIESVCVGGADAWYMIGHAYFDRAFSEKFAAILKAEYDLPQTASKLWEDLYIEHLDELDMAMQRFDPPIIYEFDSVDELRVFDPLFLENVDSEIVANICETLGCKSSEIRDVYPLKQGLTNLSCHFTTDSGEFVYRHPGIGTEQMIDRATEVAAQRVAKEIGLDGTFIAEDPQKGWKLSKFIPNCRQLDPHDDAQLARAMRMAADLHAQDVQLDRVFDYAKEAREYERMLLGHGPIQLMGFREMADAVNELDAYVKADGAGRTLTHNDFFCLNLLIDEADRIHLIDWEYAGMADYASDFGTFVVTCQLSEQEAERALEHYFGRTPTPEEHRHNFAHVALAGWCWYVWSLLKEAEGDYVGEWLRIYYKYAAKYLPMSLELYRKNAANVEGVAR